MTGLVDAHLKYVKEIVTKFAFHQRFVIWFFYLCFISVHLWLARFPPAAALEIGGVH